MLYRKNIGSKESGVLTALTGLIGFCPACAMAGRKSLEGQR